MTCDALIRRGKLEWKRKRSCTAINLNLYIVLYIMMYIPPAKTKRRAPAKQITARCCHDHNAFPHNLCNGSYKEVIRITYLKLVQQKAC